MTTNHTPTPWRACEGWDDRTNGCIIDGNGTFGIASALYMGGTETARANAAFIVLACNAHDELVEALRSAQVALSFCGKSAQARALLADASRKVGAALAKVRQS